MLGRVTDFTLLEAAPQPGNRLHHRRGLRLTGRVDRAQGGSHMQTHACTCTCSHQGCTGQNPASGSGLLMTGRAEGVLWALSG